MPKSTKATVVKRIGDLTRLVLAGAAFHDIRQYAREQGWNLSDRQLRRYQEEVYKRLATDASQNQQQLLGRHLMQRRALYARAVKTGDLRAALLILKDEAALEGLYGFVGDQSDAESSPTVAALPREDRLRRWLKAEAAGDASELRLLQQITPHVSLRLTDLELPRLLLSVMAAQHQLEQLELAGLALLASNQLAALPPISPDEDSLLASEPPADYVYWARMQLSCQYRYQINHAGWRLFQERLGLSPEVQPVAGEESLFQRICDHNLLSVPFDSEVLADWQRQPDGTVVSLVTAEDRARDWWSLLQKLLESTSESPPIVTELSHTDPHCANWVHVTGSVCSS